MFKDTKDLNENSQVNKEEREAVRNLPTKGLFKEIEAGAGNKTFKMDRRGIWLGSQLLAEAPFSVSMDGLFKLFSQDGNGSIGMSAEQGIWLGADNFDDAPFSVDMAGNIKIRASSLTQNTSMTMYDEDGNLSIYLGFKDIT
jgi:hypothetical protein